MYGIKLGNKVLGVFHFPNAKKPRLCILNNAEATLSQYAICNDDECAKELMDFIAELCALPKVEAEENK